MSNPFQGLSVRTSNALLQLGYKHKIAVKYDVWSKIIHPSNIKAFGIGWKSYNEIRQWLGMKIPTSPRKICYLRCQMAYTLWVRGNSFEDINRVMKLGSKELARQAVAKFKRLETQS